MGFQGALIGYLRSFLQQKINSFLEGQTLSPLTGGLPVPGIRHPPRGPGTLTSELGPPFGRSLTFSADPQPRALRGPQPDPRAQIRPHRCGRRFLPLLRPDDATGRGQKSQVCRPGGRRARSPPPGFGLARVGPGSRRALRSQAPGSTSGSAAGGGAASGSPCGSAPAPAPPPPRSRVPARTTLGFRPQPAKREPGPWRACRARRKVASRAEEGRREAHSPRRGLRIRGAYGGREKEASPGRRADPEPGGAEPLQHVSAFPPLSPSVAPSRAPSGPRPPAHNAPLQKGPHGCQGREPEPQGPSSLEVLYSHGNRRRLQNLGTCGVFLGT
uniref:basic proline-rich protein-like n=1 Tax=Callithrix jacchus TaxID=9483 RepID=UPI0023DD27E8|nr:basic proline-rich protein-like [Callithrix jacchus]